MEKALLVLAAGMGSRYGGLKQMEGFGPQGETILEYSIYDALRAGFSRFIFVIRKSIEADFRERVLSRLPRELDCQLCFQELEKLPVGHSVPQGRQKPWGTGHAVWVARDLISGPFAIVNGDDFYGRNGFQQLAQFFESPDEVASHAMVAYPLGRTLSESGAVSRGICRVNEQGELLEMREVHGICRVRGQVSAETESPVPLSEDSLASMNLFGFAATIFDNLDRDFLQFLLAHGSEQKSEFYIPSVVNQLLKDDEGKIQVLKSLDDWMGVTNPDDRKRVVAGIRTLIDSGVYPESLWTAE